MEIKKFAIAHIFQQIFTKHFKFLRTETKKNSKLFKNFQKIPKIRNDRSVTKANSVELKIIRAGLTAGPHSADSGTTNSQRNAAAAVRPILRSEID